MSKRRIRRLVGKCGEFGLNRGDFMNQNKLVTLITGRAALSSYG